MTADTTTPPAAAPERHHPNGLAVLWAVTGYPLAAFLWAMAAGVATAVDSARGPGEAIGWFLWATLWMSIAALMAAVIALPLLAIELLLWRQVVARVRYFERDRITVVQAAALLALPWVVVNPLPWGALVSFGTVFAGLAVSRLGVPRLAPGALL